MKRIALSAMALGLMGSINVQAAEDLSSMFSEGKTSGQIRMFHINRDDNTKAGKQIGTALGGHLKFETADYKGLSLGTAFYTTNGMLSSLEDDAMGINKTLVSNSGDAYSILGEAYLQYKTGNTVFKAGRQKLATPMAGADDARMLPNLFEAYLVINSDVKNTTLIAGHVTQFAAGSFSNAYNGGAVGATGGYTAVAGNTAKYQGQFTNMGNWAVGEETNGVSVVAAAYKNGAFKAQLWDYIAHDIANIVYADASLSWKCMLSDTVKPFAAAQIIKENAIGEKYGVGDLDSTFFGVKLGAKVENLTAYVAYSVQSEADSAAENVESSTVTPWGGIPAYTQGMVTRHMFIAGTKATKIAASYNFKDMGANVSATGYYATFDLDANSGLGAIETKEPGFDIKYAPASVKNLGLRLRGNFPTDFTNGRDWSEYRFIANYNF